MTLQTNSPSSKSFLQKAGAYVIGYLFLLIVFVSLIFLLFNIRGDVIDIAFFLGKNSVQVRGISNLAIMLAGIVMLVGLVYSDDYLRRGIIAGKMWKHILHIALAAAGAWLIELLTVLFIKWVVL